MVITDRITAGEHDATVHTVNGCRLVMQQLDALGRIKLGWPEQQIGLLDLAQEVGLGQGRALVRQAWLIANQGNAPVIAFLTQGGSDLKTGLASTDDND
ncbi:hypothetical protein D9M71_740080 [compost metagenome]